MFLAACVAVIALPNCREAPNNGAVGADDSAFPRLTGRVVDQADLLTPDEELYLSKKSQALEARTGRQFVVVTVNSLNGRDVTDYTRDLGNFWRIGRKDYNDGTILLMAPSERKVRIATGDGLADALPDARAERIVEDVMLPRFRDGDLDGGVVQGAEAIVEQLSDHP